MPRFIHSVALSFLVLIIECPSDLPLLVNHRGRRRCDGDSPLRAQKRDAIFAESLAHHFVR